MSRSLRSFVNYCETPQQPIAILFLVAGTDECEDYDEGQLASRTQLRSSTLFSEGSIVTDVASADSLEVRGV